jgi:hypothetical protein
MPEPVEIFAHVRSEGMEAPRDANDVVEERLVEIAARLEHRLDADVIGLLGPLGGGVEQVLRDVLEERGARRESVAVILTTPGGVIEVVERMVAVLRRHHDRVLYFVPDHAMSAGTVLVMSGDEIWMDYYSVLGPIDPQVAKPGGDGYVPALGYLEQYERLVERSLAGQLSMAEVAFLLERFDPADLWLFEQAQELSTALLVEWLAAYKFRDWTVTESRGLAVTDEMRRRRAGEIAEQLNQASHWHSHSRGISRVVLEREMNLRIDDLGTEPDLQRDVRAYHHLLDDYAGMLRHVGVVHSVGGYVPFATEP